MTAIILAVLQILLLLLKAYFSKDDDRDRAWKHVQDAQAKLNAIAQSFEDKNRYSKTDPAKMDQFQDAIDRNKHDGTYFGSSASHGSD